MRRILFAIALLAPCIALTAQQPRTGQIEGHVRDDQGAVISRANVFVRAYAGTGDKIERAMQTDIKGNFTLTLQEGAYDVIVSSEGFKSILQTIIVRAGKSSKSSWVLPFEGCDFPVANCDTFPSH